MQKVEISGDTDMFVYTIYVHHTCINTFIHMQAAEKRADANAGSASAAESELLSKITELNEKCARFYQDREDARELLDDAHAAVAAYKKALLAAKSALKNPVVCLCAWKRCM